MRRIILLFMAAATMATVPSLASADPADVSGFCERGTDAAGVLGTECSHVVVTPSDNVNVTAKFRPDVQGDGGTVQQGAQHDLRALCDSPHYFSCNQTWTPAGNANGTFHFPA